MKVLLIPHQNVSLEAKSCTSNPWYILNNLSRQYDICHQKYWCKGKYSVSQKIILVCFSENISDSLNTYLFWHPLKMLTMTMTTFILRYRFNMCSSWSPACFTTSTQFSTQSCTQSSQSVSAEDSPTYLESAGSTRYMTSDLNFDLKMTWNLAEVCKSCVPSLERGKQPGPGVGRVQPGEQQHVFVGLNIFHIKIWAGDQCGGEDDQLLGGAGQALHVQGAQGEDLEKVRFRQASLSQILSILSTCKTQPK